MVDDVLVPAEPAPSRPATEPDPTEPDPTGPDPTGPEATELEATEPDPAVVGPAWPGRTRLGLSRRGLSRLERSRLGRSWPGRSRRILTRVAAAVLAGLLLVLAFPPYDAWWLAPFAVALLAMATRDRGIVTGAGLGLLTGLTWFVPLLRWSSHYVGGIWLLLPALEAGYLALLGAGLAACAPLTRRWPWSWPPLVAVLWVGQEALRDRTPFGGFPWGRLAFSQADAPLLRLASLGGAPLVTFGTALVGGLLALGAYRSNHRRPARTWLLPLALAAAGVLAPLLLPTTAPTGPGPTGPGPTRPAVTVAVVQGNVPRLGLDFNAQRRAVLDNHVRATLELAARVREGLVSRPDLVVWPENASDIDPLANPDATVRITQAARAIGAPILVGGLLDGPGDRIRNVGMVWLPDSGPGEVYVKRHPVPFAEYVPWRSLFHALTDKVDLVRADFLAGTTPGVLQVGPATVGDVICFEVADDGIVRDTVTGGAQLIVVQTNNATFDRNESVQQLAMVRLRAVEHGRPALMASTVGVSGFVDPAGQVADLTGFDTAAVIVRELHLGAGRTMATELGAWPEFALAGSALLALAAAAALRRRETRHGRPDA